MENYGVIIKPVQIGADIPYEVVNASGDWTNFLPQPETQTGINGDKFCCVTEAFVHILETQMNYAKDTGKFTDEQIAEMQTLNYINGNGSFEFSVRFLATLDGTTHSGNDGSTVYEKFLNYGIIGNVDYPSDPNLTWEQFYAPISQDLINKGQSIFKYIDLSGMNWVLNGGAVDESVIAYRLKQAPLQIYSPICPSYNTPINGIIGTCNLTVPQHSMEIAGQDILTDCKVWDTYPPYLKTFAKDYPYMYISQCVIKVIPDPQIAVLQAQEKSLIQQILAILQAKLNKLLGR
jgi:hypothetical protein